MQRFVTVNESFIMPYTGCEITVIRMGQNGCGRLVLNIADVEPITYYIGPPPHPFVLAIILGDLLKVDTWEKQVEWGNCLIDVENLHLDKDLYLTHILPIDFRNT